jgi:hypothetical protein
MVTALTIKEIMIREILPLIVTTLKMPMLGKVARAQPPLNKLGRKTDGYDYAIDKQPCTPKFMVV